jgi:hypothetical protein
MKQYISSIAGIISIAACFFIAAVGVISGLDPATCCYRAVCGAVFVYVVSTIALRLMARIVITAMVDSKLNEEAEVEA